MQPQSPPPGEERRIIPERQQFCARPTWLAGFIPDRAIAVNRNKCSSPIDNSIFNLLWRITNEVAARHRHEKSHPTGSWNRMSSRRI
jgi:hypothetical protein